MTEDKLQSLELIINNWAGRMEIIFRFFLHLKWEK